MKHKIIATSLLFSTICIYGMEPTGPASTPNTPPPSQEDVEMARTGVPAEMHQIVPEALGIGNADELTTEGIHERIVERAIQNELIKNHSPESIRKALNYMRNRQRSEYGRLAERARAFRGEGSANADDANSDAVAILSAITGRTTEEYNEAQQGVTNRQLHLNYTRAIAVLLPTLIAAGWGLYAKFTGTDPNTCAAEFTNLLGNTTQQISGIMANITHLLTANLTTEA